MFKLSLGDAIRHTNQMGYFDALKFWKEPGFANEYAKLAAEIIEDYDSQDDTNLLGKDAIAKIIQMAINDTAGR